MKPILCIGRAAVVHGMLAIAALLAAGCWQPPPIQRAEQERGLILVLEGIDFTVWQMADTYRGLRDAGIDCAIDVPDWGYRSRLLGGYRNLTDLPNNRREAARFAARITEYQRDFPGRPVSILGYSGGGGLAILAAEALPAGVRLDRIVLIGAAISPEYDIAAALERCERGIVNFYSSADGLILGTGTRLYGTIDRHKTPSAGHVGFRVPAAKAASRPALYAKLTQIAWTPADWKLGHDGGHFGWIARRWAAEVLAPHLRPVGPQTRPDGEA